MCQWGVNRNSAWQQRVPWLGASEPRERVSCYHRSEPILIFFLPADGWLDWVDQEHLCLNSQITEITQWLKCRYCIWTHDSPVTNPTHYHWVTTPQLWYISWSHTSSVWSMTNWCDIGAQFRRCPKVKTTIEYNGIQEALADHTNYEW